MNREIWLGNTPKEPVFWDYQDRQGTLYGKRSDGVKVVKVGMQIPRMSAELAIGSHEQEAHSLVRNHYKRIISHTSGIVSNINSNMYIQKTDGNYDSAYSWIIHFSTTNGDNLDVALTTDVDKGYIVGVSATKYGMALGTGNTAWDIDDYILATRVGHGITSGLLYYYGNFANAVSYESTSRIWVSVHRRLVSNFNADASDIEAKEIGQYVPFYTVAVAYRYLDERTVLDTPVTIAYRHTKRMRYTRSLTIPSGTTFLANAVANLVANSLGCNNVGASFGAGYRSMKDTGGTIRNGDVAIGFGFSSSHEFYFYYGNVAANVDFGSVAGYSDTAINFDDYALNSKFAEGAGENQLSYSAQDIPTFAYNAGAKTYTAQQSRLLTNGYGSSQVIKNVGLISKKCYYSANTINYFLEYAKVLSSPVTLDPTESLLIIHEWNMTHA
jgi:hypothetical protein